MQTGKNSVLCPLGAGQTSGNANTICRCMVWAHEVEQNLERLRRYAVLACGSPSRGDNVVENFLASLLTDGVPEGPACAEKLFQRLDTVLAGMEENPNGMVAGLGRWQLLEPLERRLVLLVTMEGFSCDAVGRITGLPEPQVRANMARAQMRYADRFPARIGLVGATGAIRESMGISLRKWGHTVLWSLPEGRSTPDSSLDVPGLIIAVGGADDDAPIDVDPRGGDLGRPCLDAVQANLGSAFLGPVIVARGKAKRGRLDNRVWHVPVADLSDTGLFRRAIANALLFTA